jgi:osmotically inducible protein OsmC
MTRTGSAVWSGGLKDGAGKVSTHSKALNNLPYSFHDRFEDGQGTNPEELLAAAHAACFSMALSSQLGKLDMVAKEISTTALLTMESLVITKVHLDLSAKIPGGDETKFQEAAQAAKAGCPVSKLFNAEITLDAKLES